MALELCRRFGIEKAVLVPYGHKSDELTRRAVAAEAAKFIEARMNDGDVLGIGWGRTTSPHGGIVGANQAAFCRCGAALGRKRS